ncbi:hypothetical protein ACWDR0_15525 [Streptomyces sp. NPDC003691]
MPGSVQSLFQPLPPWCAPVRAGVIFLEGQQTQFPLQQVESGGGTGVGPFGGGESE